MKEKYNELIAVAKTAAEKAYAPYSNFSVGAALLTKSGKIYHGCNIENSSFSVTNCAERTALFSAVADGEREFEAIAIVGGKNGNLCEPCFPCGVCRQALSEFSDGDMRVIIAFGDSFKEYTLKDLLPEAFKL